MAKKKQRLASPQQRALLAKFKIQSNPELTTKEASVLINQALIRVGVTPKPLSRRRTPEEKSLDLHAPAIEESVIEEQKSKRRAFKERIKEWKKAKPFRSPTYKQDFFASGANPKKHFQTLMTRYGIKGYRLGWKVMDDCHADFFFSEKRIAVFVGQDLTSEQVVELEETHAIYPLVIESEELGVEWIEACAQILNEDVSSIQPVNSWCFSRAKAFEIAAANKGSAGLGR